jgi:predicted P-loop ATPase
MMDDWVTSVAHLKKNEVNKLCRLLKKGGVTTRNIQYWRADIKETSKEMEEARKAATRKQDDDKILVALHSLGYTFKLNECNGYIEVNGENLADPLAAKIRVQMRKLEFHSMPAVEDTYIANAYDNRYHPLKDYLRSLKDKWDGQDHIAKLASYFQDAHEPILCDDGIERTLVHIYLRRWTIGAVAKIFGDGQLKNYCIVFEGKQGLGKSYVIVWLASVMPRYFIEDEVKPSNKDHKLRLTSNWLWDGRLPNWAQPPERQM